jgi:citrate lyase subunit beta/citryl-CoA lyase
MSDSLPTTQAHPRAALFDPDEKAVPRLPVCDHYSGVESRMRKSLELQAEWGPVFDVTLDNEDGAPVGGEVAQAQLIAELLDDPLNRHGRVGVRLLPVDHARFADVLHAVLRARRRPAYLMLPKPRGAGRSAACRGRHRRRRGRVDPAARAGRDPRRRCARCRPSPPIRASSRCRSG